MILVLVEVEESIRSATEGKKVRSSEYLGFYSEINNSELYWDIS